MNERHIRLGCFSRRRPPPPLCCYHRRIRKTARDKHATLRRLQGRNGSPQTRGERSGTAGGRGGNNGLAAAAALLFREGGRGGRQGGAGRLPRVGALQPPTDPPVRRAPYRRRDRGSLRSVVAGGWMDNLHMRCTRRDLREGGRA